MYSMLCIALKIKDIKRKLNFKCKLVVFYYIRFIKTSLLNTFCFVQLMSNSESRLWIALNHSKAEFESPFVLFWKITSQ